MFLLIYCLRKTKNNKKCFTSHKVFKSNVAYQNGKLIGHAENQYVKSANRIQLKCIRNNWINLKIFKRTFTFPGFNDYNEIFRASFAEL